MLTLQDELLGYFDYKKRGGVGVEVPGITVRMARDSFSCVYTAKEEEPELVPKVGVGNLYLVFQYYSK